MKRWKSWIFSWKFIFKIFRYAYYICWAYFEVVFTLAANIYDLFSKQFCYTVSYTAKAAKLFEITLAILPYKSKPH